MVIGISTVGVEDGDVDGLRRLRRAVAGRLPANLRSHLGRDRDTRNDLVSEVIAEAWSTYKPGRCTFRTWCGYLASRRGWELYLRLLGADAVQDAPLLSLDADHTTTVEQPTTIGASADELHRHDGLLDRLRPLLSERQFRIVGLLAEGYTLAGVANDLGLSREALNYQKKRIASILAALDDELVVPLAA